MNDQEKIEFEKKLDQISESVGEILDILYKMSKKIYVKDLTLKESLTICLTLLIKNIERNLIDREIETNFEEIISLILETDLKLKQIYGKKI